MKVCTDACLFGAYAADNSPAAVSEILDIGTGTGLLSLMLAQKTHAVIDAIEINAAAAAQARENVAISPWPDRIRIFNVPLQQFKPAKQYDLIISNPPFFENDLKSPSEKKNDAKHDSGLTLQELVHALKAHLAGHGFAAILLPFHRTIQFKNMVQDAGLFVQHVMEIKQTPHHDFFRSIVFVGRFATGYSEKEMRIHEVNREYSVDFTNLLKDFYLNL
jgi:tRNA1Val (adenine37-N6)-methyltransferase